MDYVIGFIKSLPLEFYILCVYLLILVPRSYDFLYEKTSKEVEKLEEQKPDGDIGSYSIDSTYMMIAAFFHPLIVILSFLQKVIEFVVEVVNWVVNLAINVFMFIVALLVCGFVFVFNIHGGKNKKMIENNTVEETKVMTKDNVLLYEKHDVTTTEALSTDSGKTYMIHGTKIFRVIKPENGEFNVIAQYLAETDRIDLSVLKDYTGWFMASVDRDAYDHDKFVWNCVELGEGSEDSEVFTINNPRECTEEEVKLLNELFPEYYDHAF